MPMSVVDTLYSTIKDEILRGDHTPGTAMRQHDIAARFGVSRVPLREAFSRLEAVGLLTLRPRRGYAVPAFNADEIREIFDLRAVVEEHAGRLASQARTATDIDAVRSLADRMAAIDLSAPDTYDQWCLLNHEFHLRIIEASRRQHVIKFAQQLRDIVEPYIRLELSISDDNKEADSEHAQIAGAFANGDAKLVGTLSAQHCFHTRDRLISALQARENASG